MKFEALYSLLNWEFPAFFPPSQKLSVGGWVIYNLLH